MKEANLKIEELGYKEAFFKLEKKNLSMKKEIDQLRMYNCSKTEEKENILR